MAHWGGEEMALGKAWWVVGKAMGMGDLGGEEVVLGTAWAETVWEREEEAWMEVLGLMVAEVMAEPHAACLRYRYPCKASFQMILQASRGCLRTQSRRSWCRCSCRLCTS